MNEPRYQVVNRSVSAHCCFSHSVIDTQTQHSELPSEREWVCECWNEAQAYRIAEALNKEEQR